jgi:mono/diheme cytochrome c family protein
VRPATVAAGVLTCAAAAMAAAALATGGGGDEERAVAPATPAPAAARDGKAVWVANGCGSCHTFAPAGAKGEIGPDLAATLKGVPASYIRDSIVAPSKVAAAGYTTGMMPEDYAARISPAELDALVELIRSGVRD